MKQDKFKTNPFALKWKEELRDETPLENAEQVKSYKKITWITKKQNN